MNFSHENDRMKNIDRSSFSFISSIQEIFNIQQRIFIQIETSIREHHNASQIEIFIREHLDTSKERDLLFV